MITSHLHIMDYGLILPIFFQPSCKNEYFSMSFQFCLKHRNRSRIMSGYTAIESEHLCYMRCNNCSTVLAVNVPCTTLFNTVRVKCGHCNGLLCVDLKDLHLQLPLPFTLGLDSTFTPNGIHSSNENISSSSERSTCEVSSSDSRKKKQSISTTYRVPGKKLRGPSVYNHFIKEEIHRIKASNPDMSHKQAFRTAAKNWALFP